LVFNFYLYPYLFHISLRKVIIPFIVNYILSTYCKLIEEREEKEKEKGKRKNKKLRKNKKPKKNI